MRDGIPYLPADDPEALAAAGFWYDAQHVESLRDLIESEFRLIDGIRAGELIELMEWQWFVLQMLFGWKRRDGTRRFREAYIEVPRKNAKTTIIAAVGIILAGVDGERGAEVVVAAADKEQARIAFTMAASFVEKSPTLVERTNVYANSVHWPTSKSSIKVLTAKARTKHGSNLHGIIIDELHAQTSDELFNTLRTGRGARRQPLMMSITTAGHDRASICWDRHEYARKILLGLIGNPEFFGFIAAAPDEADWTDEREWKKANPGYGISINPDFLRGECEAAKESPRLENAFRQLYLNQWTRQAQRWISLGVWDENAGAPIDAEALAGRTCYGGLDLASKADLTACVLVFQPPERAEGEDDQPFEILCHFWIPGHELHRRIQRDGVPFDAWAADGLMTITDGEITDYRAVRAWINEQRARYDLREIAFDPKEATHLAIELNDEDDIPMVEYIQNVGRISPAAKLFEEKLIARLLHHGGNPVLRWMADNVEIKRYADGAIRPIKPNHKSSPNRIDGIIALIMALDLAFRNEGADEYDPMLL